MDKFSILVAIAAYTIGLIAGAIVVYHIDKKFLHDVVSTYESGLGEINDRHIEETKRLYDLVSHYQKQHENCPYRRGAFHCVKPETLPRNEINWQEVDFPNKKGD